MNPIDLHIKELFAELLKPYCDEIHLLKKEIALMNERKEVKDFELKEWFLKIYGISSKTFHKYLKLGYVEKKRIGKFCHYCVNDFITNLDKIKTGKPDFLKCSLLEAG